MPSLRSSAMDPRGAPQRVGATHLPDQADHLAVDGPPAASTRTTLPFPELAKAGSMPADDRVRSNDPQAGLPSPPPSREPDPKGTIWTREAGRLGGAVQHQESVTEGQVLEDQVARTLQRRHGQTKEQHEPGNHAVEDARWLTRIPLLLGVPRTFPLRPFSPVPASPCEPRTTLHGWWRPDRAAISGFIAGHVAPVSAERTAWDRTLPLNQLCAVGRGTHANSDCPKSQCQVTKPGDKDAAGARIAA